MQGRTDEETRETYHWKVKLAEREKGVAGGCTSGGGTKKENVKFWGWGVSKDFCSCQCKAEERQSQDIVLQGKKCLLRDIAEKGRDSSKGRFPRGPLQKKSRKVLKKEGGRGSEKI